MFYNYAIHEYDSKVIAFWSPILYSRKKRRQKPEYQGILAMTLWDKELYTKYKDVIENRDIALLAEYSYYEVLDQLNRDSPQYFWKFRGYGDKHDEIEFFEDAFMRSSHTSAYHLGVEMQLLKERLGLTWQSARIADLSTNKVYKKMRDELVLAKMMSDF